MLRPTLRKIAKRLKIDAQARATMATIRLARLHFVPAQLEHVALLHGFATMEQPRLLHDLVANLPDGSRIVEVGVWQGRSAIAMALACRGTRKKVYAVDPWAAYAESGQDIGAWLQEHDLPSLDEAYRIFLRNRRAFRVEPWLEVIRAPSLEAARSWSHGPITMAFIDAGHEEGEVRADLDAWAPLLSPDGHLYGDDLPLEGVSRAILGYLRDHPGVWVATPDGRTWKLINGH